MTTSELAEYLGVQAQAIYDMRTDGRGPSGIRVGREIRYRVSDVRQRLDGLHEPELAMSRRGGDRWRRGDQVCRSAPSARSQPSSSAQDGLGRRPSSPTGTDNRHVGATCESRNAAQAALKADLAARLRSGGVGDSVDASSPFPLLAAAWLEDVMLDVVRSQGTKDTYQRELRALVLTFFENFTIREVTVGRIELFLRQQRAKSYSRAKHSRTILRMILVFAVRRGIIPRNPMKETSRMKKPPHTPKPLSPEQIAAIRLASSEWRTEKGGTGPRSDWQVRDLIEVMLATATRIGDVLAIRQCDVDLDADPPRGNISGTLVVHNKAGVHRQEHPKTHESNQVIGMPPFAVEVIRQRLALLDPEETEHLMFYSRVGTPLAPYNVRRTFRGIVRNAGLEGLNISTHSFHRTGATLLANELGMRAAADLLGHTSTSSTKAHYAEPDRTVKSEPAEVMQRLAPPE
ncbi:tyrosine-type recombinase/integrase [Cryobacterium ruanii]|uniref:Helix-turn-helix domain-containing protein n=1 Tax=Cryobacterium ruanii TaxID=1259197 RepID=A0A4R9APN1_9MICO|nr:tyrosine-type recombinase/integrase [Cryobacterium ruanii]TFD67720.1 helix-turn-helix domain-containing protein [Cryobacterium ruanii]